MITIVMVIIKNTFGIHKERNIRQPLQGDFPYP